METLSANDSVSTPAISRCTTGEVVLAEQVPAQYQFTGVDRMSVLQCSVTEVPSTADVLRGVIVSAASLCVKRWQTRGSRMMPAGGIV